MNLEKTVELGLQAQGFDGLVVLGICGCKIGDLNPGECLSGDCTPGHVHNHSSKPDTWIVSISKQPVSDAEIEETIRQCG